MWNLEDFIIVVFCLVDDAFKQLTRGQRLRRRGFAPALSDSEVLTMEIVGEFLGYDTDEGIWGYFGQHWRAWFPDLGARTTFVRQAANLWAYKLRLQQALARQLGAWAEPLHLVDGFPLPVCRFARARTSRVFRGPAAYGQRKAGRTAFYGFCGQLVVSQRGIITAFTLLPANRDEREGLWDLVAGITGLLGGDKGYVSAPLREALALEGINLQTELRANMRDDRPPAWVHHLRSVRQLIETVIGQLSERFHIQRVRARDLWHLTSRLARKLLAHTVAVYLNLQHRRAPLQFDGLVIG